MASVWIVELATHYMYICIILYLVKEKKYIWIILYLVKEKASSVFANGIICFVISDLQVIALFYSDLSLSTKSHHLENHIFP